MLIFGGVYIKFMESLKSFDSEMKQLKRMAEDTAWPQMVSHHMVPTTLYPLFFFKESRRLVKGFVYGLFTHRIHVWFIFSHLVTIKIN